MKNKENAGDFLCTDEERLLISRATELSVRGENSAVALSFLSPREQRLVYESLERNARHNSLFFWGGYPGAERRRGIFLPSWLMGDERPSGSLFSEEREQFFLKVLSSVGMESLCEEYCPALSLVSGWRTELSHRDYLGALMALGIKRSVLGDICVLPGRAVLFCDDKAVRFIEEELKSAGREKISCERILAGADFRPERRFESISTTVASPRLDGVVRALCHIPRDEAAGLVAKGMAEVNYFTEKETDRTVKAGDVVCIRGYGKFVIDSAEDVTKRNRIRLEARKYV